MSSLRLEHYNIRTTHLDATIRFYSEVLGLVSGYRPSNRPGAWMYDRTDTPVVHITGVDPSKPEAMAELDAHLGSRDPASLVGSGAIDHVAFDAGDYDGFCKHLTAQEVPFTEREVVAMSLKQLFIVDPNGITVELNFRPPSEGSSTTVAAPVQSPAIDNAYQQVTERARALIPALQAAAQETEAAGQILPAMVDRFHSAGLFRIVQPRRVGGHELDATIFFDVCAELAKGCASSSWVLGNIASHHLMLAHWPERAQDEVWGPSADTLIGSSYVFPSGRAERVEGGYLLTGKWPFSSGIDPCQWVQLGAMLVGPAGSAPERRYFLLPRQDYTVLDTWKVAGLQGTGSKDVSAQGAFVPEYRTVAYSDLVECTSPGLQANPQALFRFPFWAAGGYVLIATLYGAALGALEQFTARARETAARSSGQGISGHVTLQQRLGKAAALLDTVDMTVRRHLGDITRMLEADGKIDQAYGAKVRRDVAYTAGLCVEAIDLIFAAGGGSALYSDNPLQRAWRDIHAGAANFTLQWDVVGPAYGRIMLGLPSGLPGLP